MISVLLLLTRDGERRTRGAEYEEKRAKNLNMKDHDDKLKINEKKNDVLKDGMQLLYLYQAEAISSKFDEYAGYSSTLYHSKHVEYNRKKKQNMLTQRTSVSPKMYI